MPNHVQNILTIIEHDDSSTTVQDVLNFLNGEPYDDGSPRLVDFNKLLPMPESLSISSGSAGDAAYKILKRFGASAETRDDTIQKIRTMSLLQMEVPYINTDEKAEEAYNLGVQYLNNKHNHGHTTWYDWCIENWETKWNAYEAEVNDNKISFQTAWSPVLKLVGMLAKQFPDLSFQYDWADEDTGYNVGQCEYDCGVYGGCYEPEGGSNEAYELCFKIRPDTKGLYKLIDGEYVFDEEEDERRWNEYVKERDENAES